MSDSSLVSILANTCSAWVAVSVVSVSDARATDRAWVGLRSLRTAGSVVSVVVGDMVVVGGTDDVEVDVVVLDGSGTVVVAAVVVVVEVLVVVSGSVVGTEVSTGIGGIV